MKNNQEKWDIIGLSRGNAPCFMTGDTEGYRTILSGTVRSEAEGKRILAMFGGAKFAQLTKQGNLLQIEVGANPEYSGALQRLMNLVKNAGGISSEIIQKTKGEIPMNPKENCAIYDKRTVIFEEDRGPG